MEGMGTGVREVMPREAMGTVGRRVEVVGMGEVMRMEGMRMEGMGRGGGQRGDRDGRGGDGR